MRDLIIVGCGGFGREVHDVVDAVNDHAPTWNLLGYADDNASADNIRLISARGSRLLGTVADVLESRPAASVAIGIGSAAVRKSVDEKFVAAGWEAATLVHPSSTMGADVRLGAGTIICAGVRLTTNIAIGRSVHLNLNVTVGHDVTLHDYVSVNPLVAISGSVEVGEGVMFGTHSSILQGLTVGPYAVVGAGACVVKPVPAGATVKGVPAR